MSSELQLCLIRHPPVDASFKGICYGASDVPLAADWEKPIEAIIERIKPIQPEVVWTSDLARAFEPGRRIALRLNLLHRFDSRLREREYGTWQGIAWSGIPSAELDRAHEMLEHPDVYRPGGGETTDEVIRRGDLWLNELRNTSYRCVVVVSHSGWITALVGSLLNRKPLDWNDYYLKPLEGFLVKTFNEKWKQPQISRIFAVEPDPRD